MMEEWKFQPLTGVFGGKRGEVFPLFYYKILRGRRFREERPAAKEGIDGYKGNV